MPQADLARPLGHRDQHDVHDADAADDQRDRGDAGEQRRQRAAGLLQRAGHLLERDLIELRQVGEHEHRGRRVEPLGQRLGRLGPDREVVGHAGGLGAVAAADAMALRAAAASLRSAIREASPACSAAMVTVSRCVTADRLLDGGVRHEHRFGLILDFGSR